MKFENKGKWLKEAEDKLAAYDTQEHPDYLEGDNKVCTFEDDEMQDFEEDELDIVEEDDTLDSPEEEEDALMLDESSQKNEAIGDSEWQTYALKQLAEAAKRMLRDFEGVIQYYDKDTFEEELAPRGLKNYREFIDCHEKLKKYFQKVLDLVKILNKIDIDADDLNTWFKPLSQFVKSRKIESSQKNEATMSDIKAKLKGAKEVPIGHYKRGNEQTIVANDSKGEHRLIISDTGYARLLERLNANGRGEKVVEKVFKLNESSQKNEASSYKANKLSDINALKSWMKKQGAICTVDTYDKLVFELPPGPGHKRLAEKIDSKSQMKFNINIEDGGFKPPRTDNDTARFYYELG